VVSTRRTRTIGLTSGPFTCMKCIRNDSLSVQGGLLMEYDRLPCSRRFVPHRNLPKLSSRMSLTSSHLQGPMVVYVGIEASVASCNASTGCLILAPMCRCEPSECYGKWPARLYLLSHSSVFTTSRRATFERPFHLASFLRLVTRRSGKSRIPGGRFIAQTSGRTEGHVVPAPR